MSFIAKLLGGGQGKKAAQASMDASNVAAGAKTDALNYLKQEDELPSGIRAGALEGLAGYFGIPGYGNNQQQVIDEAKSSPLYQAILGSRKSGEESIMRNQSATGGLRSGNTQGALTDYNMNLENTALLQSLSQRLEGLTGLSRTPTNTNNIAGLTADIGMDKAMGITGAAQARQQGSQNIMDNILGIAGLPGVLTGLGGVAKGIGGVAKAAFSDIRLKDNIRFVGYRGKWRWYRWDWLPQAVILGLTGGSEGVLAHQVYPDHPEAIGIDRGWLTVSYEALGLEVAA